MLLLVLLLKAPLFGGRCSEMSSDFSVRRLRLLLPLLPLVLVACARLVLLAVGRLTPNPNRERELPNAGVEELRAPAEEEVEVEEEEEEALGKSERFQLT